MTTQLLFKLIGNSTPLQQSRGLLKQRMLANYRTRDKCRHGRTGPGTSVVVDVATLQQAG